MFDIGDKVICINDMIDADKINEMAKCFQTWVVSKLEEEKIEELLNNTISV